MSNSYAHDLRAVAFHRPDDRWLADDIADRYGKSIAEVLADAESMRRTETPRARFYRQYHEIRLWLRRRSENCPRICGADDSYMERTTHMLGQWLEKNPIFRTVFD